MKNKFNLLFLFSTLVFAGSCTYVYYPNYPVIADVKEKSGEDKLQLDYQKLRFQDGIALIVIFFNWYFIRGFKLGRRTHH